MEHKFEEVCVEDGDTLTYKYLDKFIHKIDLVCCDCGLIHKMTLDLDNKTKNLCVTFTGDRDKTANLRGKVGIFSIIESEVADYIKEKNLSILNDL